MEEWRDGGYQNAHFPHRPGPERGLRRWPSAGRPLPAAQTAAGAGSGRPHGRKNLRPLRGIGKSRALLPLAALWFLNSLLCRGNHLHVPPPLRREIERPAVSSEALPMAGLEEIPAAGLSRSSGGVAAALPKLRPPFPHLGQPDVTLQPNSGRTEQPSLCQEQRDAQEGCQPFPKRG